MNRPKQLLVIALICLATSLSLGLTTIISVIAPEVLIKEELKAFNNSSDNQNFTNEKNSRQSVDRKIFHRQNKTIAEKKIKLGFLFGCKGLLQIFLAPLSGILVDKTFPIFAILIAAFCESIATIIYAFGESFPPFFIARSLNGFGTPSVTCGSLAAISCYFKKDEHRRKINGLLHGATFMAISGTPPLGAAVNQFFGQIPALLMLLPLYILVMIGSIPFVIDYYNEMKMKRCARSALEHESQKVLEGNQLVPLDSKNESTKEENESIQKDGSIPEEAEVFENDIKITDTADVKVSSKTPFYKLVIDPYILVTSFGLGVANSGLMGMYATVPLYMRHQFGSEQYQQGLVFLSGMAFHIVGTLISMIIFKKWSRYSYIFIMLIFTINGISIFLMLYIETWYLLAFPVGINFFTIAVSEYPLFPFLSTLVEARHAFDYGSVSAIAVVAISLAACSTSFLSGPIIAQFGFYYYMTGISCVYIGYTPLFLITAKYWK